MRRRRHARLPPASGAAGGDTDALQTDIMRFMSILGLCLMAVFALVQGIPAQAPGKPARPAQPSQAADMRQEVWAQQQQLQELQAELNTLQAARQRTQRLLTVAQQHLEEVAGQAQQAQEQRERLAAQLEKLQRQLQQGLRELTDIEQASLQKEQRLDELRGRLLNTQAQLDQSRREIEALKSPPRPKSASPVVADRPPAVPAPAAKPVPPRQGFSLRFASDAALDRLVTAGSVTLYGMADQQAWRLSLEAGGPAVTEAPFPGWFHEMSATTVPAHYLHSLDKAADGPGQSGVVWGVQLPTATRAAITALMQGQEGGVLVIRGDGRVIQEE